MRTAALLMLTLSVAVAEDLAIALRTRTLEFQTAHKGDVSLFAKNLDTGDTVAVRPTDPVRTASTIKLPILCALFDAVARGPLKWDDLLTVTKPEKVAGTGIIASEISDGVQLPLRDVAHLMMVLSDNTATNMILERLTADAVNQYLDRIGIKTTRSMRKILGAGPGSGWSAAGKLPENEKYGIGRSTPRDMVAILERLEKGEIVSPDASKEILAIMKRCQDGNGIRRKLPGIPVANKTGALAALRSDVGIVYAPTGRIAMAITVDNVPQPDWTADNPGLLLIADLAKMIVEGLGKK
jgi:beta-lactamase class A